MGGCCMLLCRVRLIRRVGLGRVRGGRRGCLFMILVGMGVSLCLRVSMWFCCLRIRSIRRRILRRRFVLLGNLRFISCGLGISWFWLGILGLGGGRRRQGLF